MSTTTSVYTGAVTSTCTHKFLIVTVCTASTASSHAVYSHDYHCQTASTTPLRPYVFVFTKTARAFFSIAFCAFSASAARYTRGRCSRQYQLVVAFTYQRGPTPYRGSGSEPFQT